MKVRVTLMTENDSPIEELGENPQEKIEEAWKMCCDILTKLCNNGDTATLEKIEIVDG